MEERETKTIKKEKGEKGGERKEGRRNKYKKEKRKEETARGGGQGEVDRSPGGWKEKINGNKKKTFLSDVVVGRAKKDWG